MINPIGFQGSVGCYPIHNRNLFLPQAKVFPIAIAITILANLPVAEASQAFKECIERCDRQAQAGLPRMICYSLCTIMDLLTKK